LLCTNICPCDELYSDSWGKTSISGKNFTGGNYNAKECLGDDFFSDKWDYVLLQYMEHLEETYECTGVCRAYSIK